MCCTSSGTIECNVQCGCDVFFVLWWWLMIDSKWILRPLIGLGSWAKAKTREQSVSLYVSKTKENLCLKLKNDEPLQSKCQQPSAVQMHTILKFVSRTCFIQWALSHNYWFLLYISLLPYIHVHSVQYINWIQFKRWDICQTRFLSRHFCNQQLPSHYQTSHQPSLHIIAIVMPQSQPIPKCNQPSHPSIRLPPKSSHQEL